MKILKTKQLTESQSEQINTLWNQEYPVQMQDRFAILLNGVDNYGHYIIEDSNENILAWAVYFEKENEIRFSIIVASSAQGKGLGTALIAELKADLGEFYGWVADHNNDKKQDGSTYPSPLAFYTKQDFEILYDTRIDTEIIKGVKIKRNVD